MKVILVSALAGVAAAFSPSTKPVQKATSLNEFANGYVGGEGPEPIPLLRSNSVNFDPCGFAEVSIISRKPNFFDDSEVWSGIEMKIFLTLSGLRVTARS